MNGRWLLLPPLVFLVSCAGDTRHRILISTASQRMIVLRDNVKIAEYPVSTSKFGLGDRFGSNATPRGDEDQKDRRRGSLGRGLQVPRDSPVEILEPDASGARPHRHPHPLPRRPGATEQERLRALHLHPRHGEERRVGEAVSYG